VKLFWGLLFLCLAAGAPAWAHKSSDSYLSLRVAGAEITGQWDIALRDLDDAVGVDLDLDGRVTWREVEGRTQDIAAYALSRLALTNEGKACPLEHSGTLIDQHSDGGYVVLKLKAVCPAAVGALEITYSLLFDIDSQHRGLLNLQRDGRTSTLVFSPEQRTLQATTARAAATGFLSYIREGIWHIWSGYDHILFLLALLLPSVLLRTPRGWKPAPSFRTAVIAVLKTVTAFTVAHSITLSCAALGVIAVPSRLVESTIAASVVIAALNNVVPLFRDRTWMVAFAFGLVHGLGFANVLFELGLPRDALYAALIGFNVGVEIGQLAIVGVFLPVAYALRPTRLYSRVIMVGGSACIIILAAGWFVERAFDIALI
jgi:hypothetical protein